MRICNRCKAPEPRYHNIYLSDRGLDMCEECYKDTQELLEVFTSMKETFMKNKNLKHIDFVWEDTGR